MANNHNTVRNEDVIPKKDIIVHYGREVKEEPKVNKKPIRSLKYQRDKDREPVKGIFHYYEQPGGTLDFCYRAYKEDPIEQFQLKDGHVYTIPLGIAKHLNNKGVYPEYSFIPGDRDTIGAFSPDGQIMKITRKIHRYGFQSLEFIDVEDIGEATDIVEVTKVI